MAHSGWYVIHVQTGREQKMCDLFVSACREADELAGEGGRLLEECFCPRFQTQRKRRGEWQDIEHPLMPGYVIAVTSNPDRLAQILRGIPKHARMLTLGEAYVPLSEQERRWLDEQTRPGERVVPMSVAYKRGDTIVITDGPLKGREWMVDKINRANSLAHLELHVGAMTIRTTVGLAVLPEEKAAPPKADEARLAENGRE